MAGFAASLFPGTTTPQAQQRSGMASTSVPSQSKLWPAKSPDGMSGFMRQGQRSPRAPTTTKFNQPP